MPEQDNEAPSKNSPALAFEARAKHLEQGYVGTKVDETPDENYGVSGVISGAPVPPIHPEQP